MLYSAQDQCISEADYLRVEESSQEKHEYVAGRIFAMSGATAAHNVLIGNLHHGLRDSVRKSGCHTFMTDMKLKIESLRSFYYPDLMVSCEKWSPDAVFLTAPCLIVEVLSPSTMNVDRREKLIAYRSISALKEYMLVYQNKKQVELYRKDADDNWHCHVYSDAEKLQLSSIGDGTIELEVDNIYADTGIN